MPDVPKILHQIWIGPRQRPQRLLDSVRRTHPDWDYRLWTDGNLPALRNQRAFDRSPTWNQKSDILRYELLWAFGGVYVDADSLALRRLDPLLANVEMFAGYERGAAGLVATGVIGCTPQHPNMERMIRDLSIDAPGHAWEIVGPLYFTRMIERYQMQLTIYPAWYFYPIHHTERMRLYRGISPSDARLRDSFLVQYWGTTTNLYEPWPRRVARRLRYALGW